MASGVADGRFDLGPHEPDVATELVPRESAVPAPMQDSRHGHVKEPGDLSRLHQVVAGEAA
jgi:hypothetical protein